VFWGTLSPTVRADQAAFRDYFVTAFKVLPGLKVAFGDRLIRVYGDTAVNTGCYTFSYVKDGETKSLLCALQLHLRQERRELAHCRPSFLGDAIGPEIALRYRYLPRVSLLCRLRVESAGGKSVDGTNRRAIADFASGPAGRDGSPRKRTFVLRRRGPHVKSRH
jgi:hypothetical protein